MFVCPLQKAGFSQIMTEGVHVNVFDRNDRLSDVMPNRAVI
jgi:hypothetical protein